MTICPEDMWLLCWLYISSFSPANGLKGGSPPGASWLLQLLFSLGVEEEVERKVVKYSHLLFIASLQAICGWLDFALLLGF